MAPDLLTTRQAAERVGRSVSTLNHYVDTGRLTPALAAPGIRGPRFFRPADVDALAAELNDGDAA